MSNIEVINLTTEIAETIAKWETMIYNNVLPECLSYFIDEIYHTLTKYSDPSLVSELIRKHTRSIGGYKNV